MNIAVNIPPALAPYIEQAQKWIKSTFDSKALLFGLGGVIGLYVVILLFIFIQAGAVKKEMESHLASQTLSIEAASLYAHKTSPAHEEHIDTGEALSPAPREGFFEKTEQGLLPRISKNGKTPFDIYKRSFVPADMKPVIALAILDYGLSEHISAEILKRLPPGVTLILSPYSTEATKWQSQARAAGHEFWLELPMETYNYPDSDSGGRTLVSHAGLKTNLSHLEWSLGRTPGYAGIAAYSDESFSKARSMLQNLVKKALGHGLGYFELNPKASHLIETIALGKEQPYARTEYKIPKQGQNIDEALKELEMKAQEQGYTVAVIKPYPNYLDKLAHWLEQPENERAFVIAPLSAIAQSENLKH